MDGQVVEEDPYSDGDLDALPDNAFHELEETAFRSTQQPASAAPARLPLFKSPNRKATSALAGGLERLSVAPETLHGQPSHGLQQQSSDYGDIDDDMLDGEIYDAAEQPDIVAVIQQNARFGDAPGESSQREQWRQQRYGRPGPDLTHLGQQRTLDQHAADLGSIHKGVMNGRLSTQQSLGVPGKAADSPAKAANGINDVNALQAQVEKLLREREQLQQAIQNANDISYAKAGEIAIVRANASKIEKEYEDRTKVMQRMHAEEAARQRADVETARVELQKIATEKDFLENDLAEGTKQIRNLQKAIKKGEKPTETKSGGKENTTATPKRHQARLGDGFNDEEIQPLSPSKLVLRNKPSTPKAGSKRKRKTGEGSPAQQPLELELPAQVDSFDEPVQARRPPELTPATQLSKPRDHNFEFVQRFLNHGIQYGAERTIEALSRYKFPSKPDKAISTILLDKMSPMNIRPNVQNLPSAIAVEIVSIWSQCIQERYHEPVHLLLDLVKYILVTNALKTAPDLTNSLMSPLQETADIIIIPRCQKKPPSPDCALISSIECLDVLHLMASQLSISRDESTRFWRTMRFDFIMMLLSFIHPLEEIKLTIRILCTSVLPSSFAMIVPPGDGKQDATEARVIDNLSRLLVESPRPSQGEPSLSPIELAQLRLSILELLDEMGANDYAALALCRHRLLLGRLVRLMNDSLAQAYAYTSVHPYLISLVNSATRLLYYLTSNYAEHVNMQQKLSVIPGGEKKFLIVLTRLAFSEGGVLEGGIEDDVVELAHRMLEERVSPEEAEGLVEAMSSAPGTKVATAKRKSGDESDEDP